MEKDVDYIIDGLLLKYYKKWKLPKEELIKDIEKSDIKVDDMDVFIQSFEIELKAFKKIKSELKFARTTQYFGLILLLISTTIALIAYYNAKLNGSFLIIYGPIILGLKMFFLNRTKVKAENAAINELKNNRNSYWNE